MGTREVRNELRRLHFFRVTGAATAGFAVLLASAAEFHPPAGDRYVQIGAAGTILPGGRILRPLGIQLETGPGPLGLALSRNGAIATADTGFERFGITVIEPPGKNGWRERHIWARTPHGIAPEIADPDWKSVASGITFDESGKSVWISEGAAGRIRQIDWNSGDTRKTVSLNAPGLPDSVAGDLAEDSARRLIYVLDQANLRVAVVDAKAGRVVSSLSLSRKPGVISLAPDGATAYVTTPDSVCAADLREPLKPELSGCVPADSPAGVLATADRIFVSNAHDDSITVRDARDRGLIAAIPLRIPSLEQYRGIAPAGMAYDPVTGWLLVAETGINAVGVVDTEKNLLIGHLPAGWMPARVAISGDRVYVANFMGRGTGPTNRHVILDLGEVPSLYHGTVTTFIMPDASEILKHTGTVFTNDGFVPWMHDPPKPPEAIQHVVLIAKKGHAFDEVLGDVEAAGNGKVQSFAKLARFGMHGYGEGGKLRFSVQDAPITPNHHAIAEKWAFSDNFYVEEGNPGKGSSDPGELQRHLVSGGVTFRRFDEGADGAIAGIDNSYRKRGEALPRFLCIQLPDKSSDAYPYEASPVADDDLAVGRIVDYLSHSPWWPHMAVFVADNDTQAGLDHVDSHRTVLLAAGPYVRRNYVSHTNASWPGLLRTILELLHASPMNLADASAPSLRDMFTETADVTPFTALMPDGRILDPPQP